MFEAAEDVVLSSAACRIRNNLKAFRETTARTARDRNSFRGKLYYTQSILGEVNGGRNDGGNNTEKSVTKDLPRDLAVRWQSPGA